jgi:hypothetical protein
MFKSTWGMVEHSTYWLRSDYGYYLENSRFQPSEALAASLGEKGLVIYCIHGTADFPAGFTRFGEGLRTEGLPGLVSCIRIITFEKRFDGSSIEEQANRILAQIKENGDENIILFGHSRGGLDAQRVEILGKAQGIKTHLVANISTPYQGSYLARWPLTYFSKSVEQMEVGSDYLKKVAKEVMETEVVYHFFEAPYDWVVPPKNCYVREYVQKNNHALTVLDDEGHLSIMGSKKLITRSHVLISEAVKNLIKKAAEEPETKALSK